MSDEEIILKVESAIDEAVKADKTLLSTGGVEDTFASTVRDKLLPLFQSESITVPESPPQTHKPVLE